MSLNAQNPGIPASDLFLLTADGVTDVTMTITSKVSTSQVIGIGYDPAYTVKSGSLGGLKATGMGMKCDSLNVPNDPSLNSGSTIYDGVNGEWSAGDCPEDIRFFGCSSLGCGSLGLR